MRRACAALLAILASAACGPDGGPAGGAAAPASAFVPVAGLAWAQVSQAQVDAARTAGVPPALETACGLRFVFVPAGRFPMGAPEDEPGRAADETLHEVDVGVGFYLQVTPTTQGELAAAGLGGAAGSPAPAALARDEALRVAAALGEQDDTWAYRLPTEAEWEYACRAGSTTRYAWGPGAAPAAPADYVNAFGLRGMHVGPREWCADRYAPLPSWTLSDHGGPNEGAEVVVRGGGSAQHPARSAQRAGVDPARPEAARCALRLAIPLGYGLGRYGATPVTFHLVDERAHAGDAAPTGGYDLRVISMNDRLKARTLGVDARWQRVPDPGSPATLTMVPGAYYVYAERTRDGQLERGKEMKFFVAAEPVDRPVPIPERDLRPYGSGAHEKPQ